MPTGVSKVFPIYPISFQVKEKEWIHIDSHKEKLIIKKPGVFGDALKIN
jgi:hypothetical protein